MSNENKPRTPRPVGMSPALGAPYGRELEAMTRAEALKEFRARLAVKLTEAGIDYKWPVSDDGIAVEVEGKDADETDRLMHEVFSEWGQHGERRMNKRQRKKKTPKQKPGTLGYLYDQKGNVIGHHYLPRIKKGAVVVGVLTNAKLDYAQGPTEWPKKFPAVFVAGRKKAKP